ncbi:MAG: sigma factor [Dehalococcoidales bacterium]
MGEQEYSEEKLVKRCQKGDEVAFRILVEKYKNLLLGTAYLILKNRQSAEEVVQETVLKMWKKLPSLRDRGSLKPWLMRILVNEANRQFRKKSIPLNAVKDLRGRETKVIRHLQKQKRGIALPYKG